MFAYLDTSWYIAEDNKELQTKSQKKPQETIKETSRCIRPEWANK